MFLIFDVETNGKPQNWKLPHTDTFNWPRMVQIAWQYYDKDRVLLESKDYIIKPEAWTVPTSHEKMHGISTERAKEEGVFLNKALNEFNDLVDKADYIITHNMNLNSNVVGAEFVRKQIPTRLFSSELVCTMQESTYYCKLKGKYGYKWPSLQELHQILFGARFEDHHQAMVDTQATANSFFKLLDVRAFELY